MICYTKTICVCRLSQSQVVTVIFDSKPAQILCHMGDFGCGDGGWTPVMKMNGSKMWNYIWTCYLMSKLVLQLCCLVILIWPVFIRLQRAFRSTKHVVVGVLELLWASKGGLWYCAITAILMTYHYQDLRSAFDWSGYMAHLLQPIRGTIQIWVVTRHHQWKFCAFLRHHLAGKPGRSNNVMKGRLFSQAMKRMLTI